MVTIMHTSAAHPTMYIQGEPGSSAASNGMLPGMARKNRGAKNASAVLQGRVDTPRHVIDRMLNSCFTSNLASCDVASAILYSIHRLPRHQAHVEHLFVEWIGCLYVASGIHESSPWCIPW